MSDGAIMALLGFAGALLVVLKPILNLNASITELKVSIDQFRESVNKLDARITEHGREIDKLRDKITEHEVRIDALEKR